MSGLRAPGRWAQITFWTGFAAWAVRRTLPNRPGAGDRYRAAEQSSGTLHGSTRTLPAQWRPSPSAQPPTRTTARPALAPLLLFLPLMVMLDESPPPERPKPGSLRWCARTLHYGVIKWFFGWPVRHTVIKEVLPAIQKAWNAGNPDALDALMDHQVAWYSTDALFRAIQQVRATAAALPVMRRLLTGDLDAISDFGMLSGNPQIQHAKYLMTESTVTAARWDHMRAHTVEFFAFGAFGEARWLDFARECRIAGLDPLTHLRTLPDVQRVLAGTPRLLMLWCRLAIEERHGDYFTDLQRLNLKPLSPDTTSVVRAQPVDALQAGERWENRLKPLIDLAENDTATVADEAVHAIEILAEGRFLAARWWLLVTGRKTFADYRFIRSPDSPARS